MSKLTAYDELKPRQQKFVDEFIANQGNATKAAISAGYSEKYAGANADKLLKNTKIDAAIKERRIEHKERNNVTIDSLVAELEEARLKALAAETPQSSAAIAATLGKAKLLGVGKLAELEIALKQAELERTQGENNNETPTPVNIVVEVKDARRNAEPEHTTSAVSHPTE